MANEADIKKVVREGYSAIAKQRGGSCCCPGTTCGCASPQDAIARKIGYSGEELSSVPAGANLGLGCGNPIALTSLREGEVVLDLGSGAGFDCFLAAERVGQTGRVIGVDMTPEMLDRARENARKDNYDNVEFRLGEIENLPVADASVDVIISNCVINLASDKGRVFQEAFRALRPGGRLMISDLVLLKELPDTLKQSIEAYIGCLAGAAMRDKYLAAIRAAGFRRVAVVEEVSFPYESLANDATAKQFIEGLNIPMGQLKDLLASVVSVRVSGVKPERRD